MLDETGKPPDIKDVYLAVIGIGIQVLGYVVSLIAQLFS